MRFFYFFLLFFSTLNIQAQHTDIDWLRRIHVERNTSLDGTMKFISHSEYVIGIGTPLAVCATGLIRKDKKTLEKGIEMSVAMIANTGATYIIKRIVNRDRPAQTYSFIKPLENEQFHSFPSGHTSNAFVLATSLSLNFPKWYVIAPAYVWASSVGYSRMHMGVHYPSDVFAGALLGAGSAIVTHKANQWLQKKRKKKVESSK